MNLSDRDSLEQEFGCVVKQAKALGFSGAYMDGCLLLNGRLSLDQAREVAHAFNVTLEGLQVALPDGYNSHLLLGSRNFKRLLSIFGDNRKWELISVLEVV